MNEDYFFSNKEVMILPWGLAKDTKILDGNAGTVTSCSIKPD